MMKLVVFLLSATIAAASVLPIVPYQKEAILPHPYRYGNNHAYGYGHGYRNVYGLGYGPEYGLGHGRGYGLGHRYGLSAEQLAYPEYGMYRPVGVNYGGAYHKGLGYGLLGMGYDNSYYN